MSTTARHEGRLDISGVGKTFKVGGTTFAALTDIDLTVAPGEFVAIVGASGCGKSTLLRLIAGLDTDYAGSIFHDGAPVVGASLARGIVFQEPRLFPWLTVAQNVALGLENAGLRPVEKEKAVAEHIDLVGLSGFENAWPAQLSGGMAQRAAMARSLVNRPGVLLLDEPFGALDSLTRARLQDELLRIREHEALTAILVTHDVEEAVYLGDRVIVMAPRPGRIAAAFDVRLAGARQRTDPRLVRWRDEITAKLHAVTSDEDPGPTRRREPPPVLPLSIAGWRFSY